MPWIVEMNCEERLRCRRQLTERQKKKEKRDLGRQSEYRWHRRAARAARTDQQRQAILQQRKALICVHVNIIYKLSVRLHVGALLLRLAP